MKYEVAARWTIASLGSCVALGAGVASGDVNLVLSMMVITVALSVAVAVSTLLAAAVVSISIVPGLASLGIVPGILEHSYFLFLGSALGASAIRPNDRGQAVPGLRIAMGAMCFVITISTALNDSELARGAFVAAVLLAPLAAILAGSSLNEQEASRLEAVLVAVALIQLPVVAIQFLLVDGGPDRLSGTFGMNGGQDICGAIAVIGAVWMLSTNWRWKWILSLALLVVPALGAVGKLILAAPIVFLGTPLGRGLGKRIRIVLLAMSISGVAIIAGLVPAHAVPLVERSTQGEGGKIEGMQTVADTMSGHLAHGMFGLGPAMTVSGTSYLSTDPLKKESSPIEHLNIAPSSMAINLGALSDASSSFSRARSSVVGLFGDFGALGLVTYLLMWMLIYRRLRKFPSPARSAAGAGVAILMVYGVTTGGFEIPALTVYVAILATVGITRSMGPKEPVL